MVDNVCPLALVDITLGGCSVQVEAAISETLPLDAVLGTDIHVPVLIKQLIDEAIPETLEEARDFWSRYIHKLNIEQRRNASSEKRRKCLEQHCLASTMILMISLKPGFRI